MSLPNSTAFFTQLLQVERDGNPLRRFGQVSPFIGKLAPLDAHALDIIARLTLAALPPLPDPTLVIGMTESSLMLSWFLARRQEPPVDLRFTTRKQRGALGLTFREPHSHGPEHFLALEAGRRFAQILIVEDELTTGATLRNLILCLRDATSNVFVVTLSDGRPPELQTQLREEMALLGMKLEVLDLSQISASPITDEEAPQTRDFCNPFGRSLAARQDARQQLEACWQGQRAGALYVVGECVDIALDWWHHLSPAERPLLQQVTRSPWVVDGTLVRTRQDFIRDEATSRYFLYNWQMPNPPHALIISEASTMWINLKMQEFLASHGLTSCGIQVSAT